MQDSNFPFLLIRLNISNAEKRCLVFDDREKQLRQQMIEFFQFQLQKLALTSNVDDSKLEEEDCLDSLMRDFDFKI